MILTYGKYAGQALRDVPRDYVEFMLTKSRRDAVLWAEELESRDLLEESSQGVTEKIVTEGFRQLAKKMHPDQGGSPEQFRSLQAAREQLVEMIKRLG